MRRQAITSPANPLIREALDVRDRRRKAAPHRVFAEGLRLIETALAAGAGLEHLFFTAAFGARSEGRAFLRRAEKAALRLRDEGDSPAGSPWACVEVSDTVMLRLSETVSPQGVAAVLTCAERTLDSLVFPGVPLLVVCDGVQDPGNLGALIRTADAAGADGVVILPGTCDPFGSKTVRSTAGSIFNIPVVRCPADDLSRYAAARGLALYATDSHATLSLHDTDLRGPAAFVFGSEARGACREVRDAARATLLIPVYGRAESLNVAAAAAVCLYEAVRQRRLLSGPG